jgi:hypothetical protein
MQKANFFYADNIEGIEKSCFFKFFNHSHDTISKMKQFSV